MICVTVRELFLPHRDAMPVREFVDADGTPWRVWSTKPLAEMLLTRGFEQGWLTFESPSTIRRLAPIEPSWEDASSTELERLCRLAEPCRRSRGRLAGGREPESGHSLGG